MSVQPIHIAAAVITNSANKTLLVRKRGTDAFMQAGGKIDAGETAEQALIRELQEELDILADEHALVPLGTFTADAAHEPGHLVVAQLFALRTDETVRPAREIDEVLWIDPVHVSGLRLAPLTRDCAIPLASATVGT